MPGTSRRPSTIPGQQARRPQQPVEPQPCSAIPDRACGDAASSLTPGTQTDRIIEYKLTPYRGSDQLADLVLTANYSQDMHRPLARDRSRVACVLGCMLLAELHLTSQITVGRDSRLFPARSASDDDSALTRLLREMHAQQTALPAIKWLEYLALDERATTWVWRRLVQVEAAQTERRWRRNGYVLTELRATWWARRYLEEQGTAAELPDAAVILWRGLHELRLDKDLELDRDITLRLDSADFPAELQPLFDALTDVLARVATPL